MLVQPKYVGLHSTSQAGRDSSDISYNRFRPDEAILLMHMKKECRHEEEKRGGNTNSWLYFSNYLSRRGRTLSGPSARGYQAQVSGYLLMD